MEDNLCSECRKYNLNCYTCFLPKPEIHHRDKDLAYIMNMEAPFCEKYDTYLDLLYIAKTQDDNHSDDHSETPR